MAKKSKVAIIKYVLKFGMGWFGAGNVLDVKFRGYNFISDTVYHKYSEVGIDE